MRARRTVSVLATAGALLSVVAPASAAPPRGTRTVAAMQVAPVCTDAGHTVRVSRTPPGTASVSTSSGLQWTPPDPYPYRPYPHQVYAPTFAEPTGPTTLTARDRDGTVLATRTVEVTSCDAWAGREGFLASGANEIGRPLYVGTLATTPERWPDGWTSYAGTAGDLWVAPDGTAHAVTGSSARLYRASGGPGGTLGQVRWSTTVQTYRDRWTTGFTGGGISSSASTGTHSVRAPFTDANCRNWDEGAPDPRWFPQSMDFPVGEAVSTGGGVQRQQYEGGYLVNRPGQGCLVLWNGPIVDYWAGTGFEAGPLGQPTEFTMSTTRLAFQGGLVLASTGRTPATPFGAVALSGPFRQAYEGIPASPFNTIGSPQAEPATTPDGRSQFLLGTEGNLYLVPSGRAYVVSDGGGLRAAWATRGWERGPMGYPAGEGFSTPRPNSFGTSGWGQRFDGGMFYGWDSRSNVLAVRGALLDHWATLGYEQSTFGFPVADEEPVPGGVRQRFQGGTLTWSAETGQVS